MKVEVEKETLSRLASLSLAFDFMTSNKGMLDQINSKLLRDEIKALPFNLEEFKEMVERAVTLVENS